MEGQFRLYSSNSGSAGINSNITQLKTNQDGSFAVGPSVTTIPGSYTGATFLVNASGNVGIGTTAPDSTLQVAGNLHTSGTALSKFDGPLQILSPGSSSMTNTTALTINSSVAGQNNVAVQFGNSGGGSLNWSIRGRSSQENDFGIYNGVQSAFGIYFNPSNNVSLGNTVDSGYKLDVTGSLRASSNLIVSGNVGIGTTTMNAWSSSFKALAINVGGLNIAGGSSSSSNGHHITDNGYVDVVGWKYAASLPASAYTQTAGTHVFRVAATGTAGNALTWTSALSIDNSGNVGIGTTNPGVKLEVNGPIKSTMTSGQPYLMASGAAGSYPGVYIKTNSDAVSRVGFELNSSDQGTIFFGSGSATQDAALSRGGAGKIYLGNGTAGDYSGTLVVGNVGIGTTAPSYPLDVRVGNSSVTVWDGSNGTALGRFSVTRLGGTSVPWSFNNYPSYSFDNNVGIGTTTPAGILDVRGGTAAASSNGTNINIYGQNAGTGNQSGGSIVLAPGTATGTGTPGAVIVSGSSFQLQKDTYLSWRQMRQTQLAVITIIMQ